VLRPDEVPFEVLTGELGVLLLGEDDFGVTCGRGPFLVEVFEYGPERGAEDELPVPDGVEDTPPVPVGGGDVEFEAVTGDSDEEWRIPVPGVELTLLTVILSVDVRVLVSKMVEDEYSSVQVVVYTDVELEAVTGDDAVEFAGPDPDGRVDERTTVEDFVVTSVSVVELADFTGPEEDPADACDELLGYIVVVLVTGIVTTVVNCVVPVPIGLVGWPGVKLPDELVKIGVDEPLDGKPPPVPVPGPT
jgi:hypothetical protein